MTAGELHDRLMGLGADLMVRALAALSRGALDFTPQPEEGVTYAHKLTNEEARIDWAKPARLVHDQVRGLSPFPGSLLRRRISARARSGSRFCAARSRQAACAGRRCSTTAASSPAAKEPLRLLQVQRAGKGSDAGGAFLRGVRFAAGASVK